MASLRRLAIALTIIVAAGSATFSDALAQSSFARCPKPEHFGDVMKHLVAATDRSKAMAEDNPLLLADVGFYEAELAATKRCAPTVAVVARPVR